MGRCGSRVEAALELELELGRLAATSSDIVDLAGGTWGVFTLGGQRDRSVCVWHSLLFKEHMKRKDCGGEYIAYSI